MGNSMLNLQALLMPSGEFEDSISQGSPKATTAIEQAVSKYLT